MMDTGILQVVVTIILFFVGAYSAYLSGRMNRMETANKDARKDIYGKLGAHGEQIARVEERMLHYEKISNERYGNIQTCLKRIEEKVDVNVRTLSKGQP